MTARITDSIDTALPVTLQVDGTPLDGNHGSFHDALFRGALSLADATDESRRILLSPPVRVNYDNQGSHDLRDALFAHFTTVPAKGCGERVVRHDLTPERLFYCDRYSIGLKRADVKPGDKFRLRMRKLGRVRWWTFGDLEASLKESKFVGEWESADAEGQFEGFEADGEKLDAETMRRKGWVFSEKSEDLSIGAESDEGGVVEFVE